MARSATRGQVGAGSRGARKQSHTPQAETSTSGPAGDLAAAFQASGLGSLLSPGELATANVAAAVLATTSAETPPPPPEGGEPPERCEFCGVRPRHGKCASCWDTFCLECCTGEKPMPEGSNAPPPPERPPAVLGCRDQREDDTCGRGLFERCQAGRPCPVSPVVKQIREEREARDAESAQSLRAHVQGERARAETARRMVRLRYGDAGAVELAAAILLELAPGSAVHLGEERAAAGEFVRGCAAALAREVGS